MTFRAVIDTNVLVSGLGWPGPPGLVVDAALAGHIYLVTSPALLDELTRVLSYPRLSRVLASTGMNATDMVATIANVSDVIHPERRIAAARDADDNRVLEAAVAGKSDLIISGGDDLLVLRVFEGIEIVDPVTVLRDHLGRGHSG